MEPYEADLIAIELRTALNDALRNLIKFDNNFPLEAHQRWIARLSKLNQITAKIPLVVLSTTIVEWDRIASELENE